ncbi:MAG: LPXTG cell wall anchor domain-containing protein [Ilumatobacteraceae bacterium]
MNDSNSPRKHHPILRLFFGTVLAPSLLVLGVGSDARAGTMTHDRYDVPVDYDCDDIIVREAHDVGAAHFERYDAPVLVVTVPEVVEPGIDAMVLDGDLDLLVFEGRVEDDYLDGDPLVPLYEELGVWADERYYFEVDEGWHTVVFDYGQNPTAQGEPGYDAPAIFEIKVVCPEPGFPGLVLPRITVPETLPKTGGGNTSLLLAAPLLVLLGGGLILVRRRLSTN